MLLTVGLAAPAPTASANTYPSWDDVLAARDNVAAQEAAISQIQGLIAGLAAEVETAQAIAEEKGQLYFEAQLAFDEAAFRADTLQAQADEAQATADESRQRAAQFVAELARAGGGDLSASLFTNPGEAEALLSRLGYASKIGEQAEGIYAVALADQNTAQSLSDQAQIAREIREELRVEAEAAFNEAQAAQIAAEEALAAQQENQNRLEVQLGVLQGVLQTTQAEFEEGERIRKEREEAARRAAEAARLAAEEAAREAARKAAEEAAAGGGDGGGANAGGSSNNGGVVTGSGWASPLSGPITSNYGNRVHPVTGRATFHAGTDIGAGCGRHMYAASGGTVNYAGWNGGYGNFVRINHGDGVTSSYGHIQSGGILVANGQRVEAGQLIALVGTTGLSSGCHLHLEIRLNGASTNPVPYLQARGVSIG
ncbi:peptidase M23-like protein [Microcella putealis]|uniref:Peptidase M23-like protein n=2 Tax=Microcella putealis TaxID=337005 RepID=A0A4Q7LM15_9MICO|nr:peptidase M23-like protein [Microcella putealis]TQM23517.1 peptidase M23-like protein [Microcella putealis]